MKNKQDRNKFFKWYRFFKYRKPELKKLMKINF